MTSNGEEILTIIVLPAFHVNGIFDFHRFPKVHDQIGNDEKCQSASARFSFLVVCGVWTSSQTINDHGCLNQYLNKLENAKFFRFNISFSMFLFSSYHPWMSDNLRRLVHGPLLLKWLPSWRNYFQSLKKWINATDPDQV